MKLIRLIGFGLICIVLAACGKSKKNTAPIDTESGQTLTDNTPSQTQVDPNQPFFSEAEYLDATVKLKEVGCKIDRVTGVTSCPEAKSLNEADSLYVLLAKFKEGLVLDDLAIKDPYLKAVLEKSVDIEFSKAKNSEYLKPIQEDIETQRTDFKVACMFGFEDTLSFQKRLASIPLMRDLCADSGFMNEIARLKVGVRYGGLVVAEKNKFSLVTTWTRLRIGFSSPKTEVLEFLAKQTL